MLNSVFATAVLLHRSCERPRPRTSSCCSAVAAPRCGTQVAAKSRRLDPHAVEAAGARVLLCHHHGDLGPTLSSATGQQAAPERPLSLDGSRARASSPSKKKFFCERCFAEMDKPFLTWCARWSGGEDALAAPWRARGVHSQRRNTGCWVPGPLPASIACGTTPGSGGHLRPSHGLVLLWLPIISFYENIYVS